MTDTRTALRAFNADIKALEEAVENGDITSEQFVVRMWKRIAQFGEELGV
jgi:hypothetical protein